MADDSDTTPPKRPRGRPRKERPNHLAAVPDAVPQEGAECVLSDGTDESIPEPKNVLQGDSTAHTPHKEYDDFKHTYALPPYENKGDELASMPTSGPEYDAAMQQAHPNYVKNREGKWVHPEDVYGRAPLEAMDGRSPKQLARQGKVFELSVVEGLSVGQICERLGISKTTVTADIRAEESLRMQELEESRDAQLVRQLMLVQRGINESFKDRLNKGTGAYGAHTELLKQRSKLLGLDAAVKIDIGFSTILDAINILPTEDDQRIVFTKIVSPTGNTALPDSFDKAVRDTVNATANANPPFEASGYVYNGPSEAQDEVSDTLEGKVISERTDALTDLTTELQIMPPIETQDGCPHGFDHWGKCPECNSAGFATTPQIEMEPIKVSDPKTVYENIHRIEVTPPEGDAAFQKTFQEVQAIEHAHDIANELEVSLNAKQDAVRAGTIAPNPAEGVIVGEPVAVDASAELLRGVKQAAEAQKLDGVAEAMGDHHSSIVGKSYSAERFGIDPATGRPTANKATVVDTFAVKLSIDQAKAKQEAQAKAQSELATHTDNLPEAKALRKPADAASAILTQDWFLAMPAQAQSEAVKAIRAQAAKDAETE